MSMGVRQEAKELVRDLSWKGRPVDIIQQALVERGLTGVLEVSEIEEIFREARAAKELLSNRPSRFWPRAIGVVAIVMAFGATWLRVGGSLRLYALILGVILVCWPEWGDENMGGPPL